MIKYLNQLHDFETDHRIQQHCELVLLYNIPPLDRYINAIDEEKEYSLRGDTTEIADDELVVLK